MKGRRDALAEFKALKAQLSRSGISAKKWREDVVHRQFAASYSDLANIKKAVLKDLERHLLRYDQASNCIIIGQGKVEIIPMQIIYGIQPYLHIEYRVKCILLGLKANVNVKVTSVTKDKISAELFDRIHVVIPVSSKSTIQPGDYINVTVEGLLPMRKGPSALYCEKTEKKSKTAK